MRTLRQIQASRANGALSRRPVTAAGKARSALNSVTHGLTTRAVVLSTESATRFEAMFETLLDRYQPADESEFYCVEEMAWAKWRLRRTLGYETALLEAGLEAQADSSQNSRAAKAFDTLCRDSAGFRSIRRHEAAHQRAYTRALEELLFLQETRRQSEPDTTQDEEQPQPDTAVPTKSQSKPNTPQTEESARVPTSIHPNICDPTELQSKPNTPQNEEAARVQ